MFKENLPKKGPLFREFWTQTPTHVGGTCSYPQHVMLPPPPRDTSNNSEYISYTGASFTIVARCLQQGEDVTVQHTAAKIIENIATTAGRYCKKFVTKEVTHVSAYCQFGA